eukprot:1158325-Pelagomonas_calceolata.AAC.8
MSSSMGRSLSGNIKSSMCSSINSSMSSSRSGAGARMAFWSQKGKARRYSKCTTSVANVREGCWTCGNVWKGKERKGSHGCTCPQGQLSWIKKSLRERGNENAWDGCAEDRHHAGGWGKCVEAVVQGQGPGVYLTAGANLQWRLCNDRLAEVKPQEAARDDE